jgi:predicted O-methyltransferase YrrM
LLAEIMQRAKSDPAFSEIQGTFAEAGIENWLKEEEKALHFGVGAFAPGEGRVLEIGTYQGGSACFLAAGIKRRGHGRLSCVDPHLGGPPWLGLAPHQRTLDKFRQGTQTCGVSEWIDARVGDSAAVASVWPADPLDAVFIDGDHSFRGALKDFESWAPKVRAGGLVLFDDADDPALPELLDLIEFMKGFRAVSHLGTIEGVAVFQMNEQSPWKLLEELNAAASKRGIHNAWDMTFLHGRELPPHYGRTRTWDEHALDVAYQLCFLARCGPGDYGYSSGSAKRDRDLLTALSEDRRDGEVLEARGSARGLRAILCRPEEASGHAPRLLPGGVLIARHAERIDQENSIRTRAMLLEAGLDGCGWEQNVHWGVWKPHLLSAEAILEYADHELDGDAGAAPGPRLVRESRRRSWSLLTKRR